jgi:hypothetical protein
MYPQNLQIFTLKKASLFLEFHDLSLLGKIIYSSYSNLKKNFECNLK